MSKAEQTRKFIIERAAPVFNKKGYSGTSLSDLIEATGLTKGSIYGNFRNKDEVASAVFDYNIGALSNRIETFLMDKDSAIDKLRGFTEFYRVNWRSVFEKGGCPIQNASIEADDNLQFMKKSVQNSIRDWAKGIRGIIEQGKKEGAFKKGLGSEEYAYTIIGVLEGGIMLAKIMNNQRLLLNALDRIDLIVETEMKA